MIVDILRSSTQSIRANLMRSALTCLGIIVGVASTIAVVSVIEGLKANINDQFEAMGSNALTIESYTPLKQRMAGKFARLNHTDLQIIQDRVDGIVDVTPILPIPGSRGGGTKYKGNVSTAMVLGTSASYINLDDWFPEKGRFILPEDDATRRRIAMIGYKVRDDLELPDDPRGEYIQIMGEWFKVAGLMEERGELLGFNQDELIMVPYSAARSLMGRSSFLNIQIRFKVVDLANLDQTREKIERLLRKKRGIKKDEIDDFKVQTADQLLENFNSFTTSITMVLGGIVAISLLVGGIGIMNIMLVSVTERTREIGINKALGATRNFIMLQFLIEAVILCLMGGLIGIAAGYGLGAAVSAMLPSFPPASVPLWAIGLALGFSASVGIVFGIAPAAKAAALDPIDALRYE